MTATAGLKGLPPQSANDAKSANALLSRRSLGQGLPQAPEELLGLADLREDVSIPACFTDRGPRYGHGHHSGFVGLAKPDLAFAGCGSATWSMTEPFSEDMISRAWVAKYHPQVPEVLGAV